METERKMHIHFLQVHPCKENRLENHYGCVCVLAGSEGGAPDMPYKLERGPAITISFIKKKRKKEAMVHKNSIKL